VQISSPSVLPKNIKPIFPIKFVKLYDISLVKEAKKYDDEDEQPALISY